jgi:hypothetical protein
MKAMDDVPEYFQLHRINSTRDDLNAFKIIVIVPKLMWSVFLEPSSYRRYSHHSHLQPLPGQQQHHLYLAKARRGLSRVAFLTFL